MLAPASYCEPGFYFLCPSLHVHHLPRVHELLHLLAMWTCTTCMMLHDINMCSVLVPVLLLVQDSAHNWLWPNLQSSTCILSGEHTCIYTSKCYMFIMLPLNLPFRSQYRVQIFVYTNMLLLSQFKLQSTIHFSWKFFGEHSNFLLLFALCVCYCFSISTLTVQ